MKNIDIFSKQGKGKFLSLFYSPGFWLILGTIVSLYRWKFRFLNAVLWAEDGVVFIQQSIEEGINSIFVPHVGYFQVVPRIIAWFSTFFPSVFIPSIFVIFCFLITIYVASTVLKKEYEYFIPDIRHRGILFLLILMAPGTPEAFGNLANLHWVLYLYLGLLGIRSIGYTYKFWELFLVVLVVFSEGATVTLLPLFGLRLLFHVLHKSGRRYYFQEIFVMMVILIAAIIHWHIKISSTTILPATVILDVLKHSVLEDFFAFPWLYKIPYRMMGEFWFVPAMYVSVFALFIVSKFFSWKSKILVPIMFFLCICTIPVMISMSRTASDFFVNHGGPWLNYRYVFLIGLGGYIFWVWIFSLLFSKKKSSLISYFWVLFISLAVVFCLYDYRYIAPYGVENKWTENASEIDQVRKNMDTQKIAIPIEPEGWIINLGQANR